jgi:Immunoglobulin domain
MQRSSAIRAVTLSLLLSLVLSACGSVSTGANDGSGTADAVAPAIQSAPVSQTVSVGSPATFTVTAIGTDPLNFEWSRNGVAIAGVNAPTYTIPQTTSADDGDTIAVTVSNAAGAAQSPPARLTVMPGPVAPSITTQPAKQSVTAGQTATFTVVASGTAPLGYQWQKNGTAILGATSPTYTTAPTVTGDDGSSFSVLVSNAAGVAQSAAAVLTVTPVLVAPTITTQQVDQAVTAGTAATFTVVASGSTPLTYQWQKGSTTIAGATAASYTTPVTATSDDGTLFSVIVTNAAGSATSDPARLAVAPAPVAPSITTQPASQTIAEGATATFSVVAAGSAPLSYQWQSNGTAIPGATASTYKTPAQSASADGTVFTVVVSNAAGSVQSSPARLTVTPAAVAPTITAQPANVFVAAGGTATFTVTATGTAPLSYQWRKNGTAIAGATSASYTTPAVTSADNGKMFSVVVSNAGGSVTSSSAQIVVTASATAPSITTQPANVFVAAGGTATFSVTATGTAPLAYQWRRNGTAIAGATSASYTTPAVTSADNGAMFSVVVSNAAGSVTSSNAQIVVTASATAPSVTTQPASQSVAPGATATFSVTASGTAPLSYRWRRNGTAIAGATAASYTTPAATSADNGAAFSVVVSNSAGTATSAAATLTVTSGAVTAPAITTQPISRSITAGSTATFTVVASGTTPLSYQWRKNGTAIAGATAASYTTPAETTADNGALFSVAVSNSAGSATSANATLTVSAAVAGSVDVTTYKYDNSRTGANTKETKLTPANVTAATFGLLRELSVDGHADAQPLYLSGLTVNGAVHNVLFVATENDSVYAFDADTGTQLWKVSLIPAGETVSDTVNCGNVAPTIGITSTPVIDRTAGAHGTMYVVAMTQAGAGTYHHRLHALDLASGGELLGGPTLVTASYQSNNGVVQFNSSQGNEHAALLLANGTLYTTWTSHCDHYYYAGWIMAYNPSTLQQVSVLNVGINSGGIGPAIWMAGSGPLADSAGNIYLTTANGGFEASLDANGFPNMGDFGNAFMRITNTGGTLAVADYFAPYNTAFLSTHDLDLGGGGNILLPDQVDSSGRTRHLMVGAGKDGNLYVVDRDSMGHFNTAANNNYQTVPNVFGNRGVDPLNGTGGIWSSPAYFNGRVYFSAVTRQLMSFSLSKALLSTIPLTNGTVKYPYPGASPSVSGNGTANGIVWALYNATPAVLYALDATTLAQLYSSADAAGGRDQLGAGNKFIVPVVANGKVFVSNANSVAVFGLLN